MSPKELREDATIQASFVSQKPPEVLAGCIAEGWTEPGLLAHTDRTANGWAVTREAKPSLLALADVVGDGRKTTVSYSSTYSIISHRDKIPAIQRSL